MGHLILVEDKNNMLRGGNELGRAGLYLNRLGLVEKSKA